MAKATTDRPISWVTTIAFFCGVGNIVTAATRDGEDTQSDELSTPANPATATEGLRAMLFILDLICDHAIAFSIVFVLAVFHSLFLILHRPNRNKSPTFPIPCHPLQPECHEDESIRSHYLSRLKSPWAVRKLWAAAWFFAALLNVAVIGRSLVGFLWPRRFAYISRALIKRRLNYIRSGDNLAAHLGRGYFVDMKFGVTGRAMAFAGRCRYHCPAFVLGYEECLKTMPVRWTGSALDHEITHCMQELLSGALTHECHGMAFVQAYAWLVCELHALLLGGPLATAGFILVPVTVIRAKCRDRFAQWVSS